MAIMSLSRGSSPFSKATRTVCGLMGTQVKLLKVMLEHLEEIGNPPSPCIPVQGCLFLEQCRQLPPDHSRPVPSTLRSRSSADTCNFPQDDPALCVEQDHGALFVFFAGQADSMGSRYFGQFGAFGDDTKRFSGLMCIGGSEGANTSLPVGKPVAEDGLCVVVVVLRRPNVRQLGEQVIHLVRLAQNLQHGGIGVDDGGPAPGRWVDDLGVSHVHAGEELVVACDGGYRGRAGVGDVSSIGILGHLLSGDAVEELYLVECDEMGQPESRTSALDVVAFLGPPTPWHTWTFVSWRIVIKGCPNEVARFCSNVSTHFKSRNSKYNPKYTVDLELPSRTAGSG